MLSWPPWCLSPVNLGRLCPESHAWTWKHCPFLFINVCWHLLLLVWIYLNLSVHCDGANTVFDMGKLKPILCSYLSLSWQRAVGPANLIAVSGLDGFGILSSAEGQSPLWGGSSILFVMDLALKKMLGRGSLCGCIFITTRVLLPTATVIHGEPSDQAKPCSILCGQIKSFVIWCSFHNQMLRSSWWL